MRHHSMYVKGFILDTLVELQPSSQGGAIPSGWARAGGWRNVPNSDPPDDFWRTLVADRGRGGRNPPVYYSRACKESFVKGGLSSGSVNTTDLINNERCSVVAQFCRRVQAVIWNRCLIKTQAGRLGLASQYAQIDDVVAILYGCSVPVVLRRKWKTRDQVNQEINEDVRHWQENFAATWRAVCQACKSKRLKRAYLRIHWARWDRLCREKWQKDEDWRAKWEEQLCSERSIQRKMAKDELSRTTRTAKAPMGNLLQNHGESEEEYKCRLQNKSFEFWKRAEKAMAKKKGKEWDEPRPNWREFELYLRFGRRWKAVWTRTNELNLARERLAEIDRMEQGSLVAARRRLFIFKTKDEAIRDAAEKRLAQYESNQRAIRIVAQDRLIMLESKDQKIREAAKECLAKLKSTNEAAHAAAGEGKRPIRCHVARAQLVPDDGSDIVPDLPNDVYVNSLQQNGTENDHMARSAGARIDTLGRSAALPKATTNLSDETSKTAEHDDPTDSYVLALEDKFMSKFKLDREPDIREPEHSSNLKDSEEVQRWKQDWCYYEVLGECYVHGMMDGEAMAYQNETGIRAQVFELR